MTRTRRKVLVLGGTGWLGRTIAQTALRAGAEVTCAARGATGPPAPGRSLRATLRRTLLDERERGLDRDRRAGLCRADELAVLARARPAGPAGTRPTRGPPRPA